MSFQATWRAIRPSTVPNRKRKSSILLYRAAVHPPRRPEPEPKATSFGCIGVLLVVIGLNFAIFFVVQMTSDSTFPIDFGIRNLLIGLGAFTVGAILLVLDYKDED